MSVLQTVLVFVGIPLGITALLAIAVYGRTSMRRDRYRPGRPWDHPTVWYVPHPSALAHVPTRPALAAGSMEQQPQPLGGASGEW
jgi:hypothetical protein